MITIKLINIAIISVTIFFVCMVRTLKIYSSISSTQYSNINYMYSHDTVH